jgi:hypothetical protein
MDTYAQFLVTCHILRGVGAQQRRVQLARAVTARDFVGAARSFWPIPDWLTSIDPKSVLGLFEVQHFVVFSLAHGGTLAH